MNISRESFFFVVVALIVNEQRESEKDNLEKERKAPVATNESEMFFQYRRRNFFLRTKPNNLLQLFVERTEISCSGFSKNMYEKKNLLVKMNNGKFREISNRKSKLKIAMAVTKYIKEGEVRSGGD